MRWERQVGVRFPGLDRAQQGDLGGRAGSIQPGFELLDSAERVAQQAIDGRVEDASWMKLIADRDFPSRCNDGATFIIKLIMGLQTTEVGPRLVETPGHAQEIDTIGSCLTGHNGIVHITPEARRGRQALNLKVRFVRQNMSHFRQDGTIVEDCRIGLMLSNHLAQAIEIAIEATRSILQNSPIVVQAHIRLA